MLRYIFNRLLWAIPTLFIISALTFVAGRMATPDPVAAFSGKNFSGFSDDPEKQSAQYAIQAKTLGFYGPLFYCSLNTSVYPDTLYRIFPYWRRDKMTELAGAIGSWQPVQDYETSLAQCLRMAELVRDTIQQASAINAAIAELTKADNLDQINQNLDVWTSIAVQHPALQAPVDSLRQRLNNMQVARMQTPAVWPAFHWYGADNQFHQWLTSWMRDNNNGAWSSWKSIKDPVKSTILINGLAVLLAFILAVPVALLAAHYRFRWPDQWIRWSMVILYAAPVILTGCFIRLWLGTQGKYLDWSGGIDMPSVMQAREQMGLSFWAWAWKYRVKISLPVLALMLHTFAMLTLHQRSSLMTQLSEDYIRTARSKGLSWWSALTRHALPNSLFPMITLFAAILPSVVGGSLAIETIFNFHGLGELMLTAFSEHNFILLMSIVLILSVVTILANLLGDLLYSWADPRVRLQA